MDLMDIDIDSDDEEILFLIEDTVFARWTNNFLDRNTFRNIFERGNLLLREVPSARPVRRKLPEIKIEPNTTKLEKSSIYSQIQQATCDSGQSLVKMFQDRESGRTKTGSWEAPERRRANNMFIPNKMTRTVLQADKLKYYCSKYSADGSRLLVAGHDGYVTVLDANRSKYTELHKCHVDQYSHSIIDLDISHDGREYVCCTWSNYLFLSTVERDEINGNYFKGLRLTNTSSHMGIFSTQFSNDSREILAAANNGCFYVYDRHLDKRTEQVVQDGDEHINAVRFLDRTNNFVICGASNNGLIAIWDRRVLNAKNPRPVGTLIGHFDGISYLDSFNDGHHFITNSKDQSIKLWDIRKFPKRNVVLKSKKFLANHKWNYMSDSIPVEFCTETKPMDGDCSVMTYRGHQVCRTLIRAKISPLETTGQRFIYSGCSTGHVIIYDTLTGKIVNKIDNSPLHVRDLDWHPSNSEIVAASFGGKVNLSVYRDEDRLKVNTRPLRRSKRIADLNSKRAKIF